MTDSDPGSLLPGMARPTFFDGERLSAADLSGVQDYGEQLRWLHSRALHDWGIFLGLDVTGAAGAASVSVDAGYAVDRLGREVVLASGRDLAVPATSGSGPAGAATWFLTASYPEASDGSPERRGGAFGTSGAVRVPTGAVLRWAEQDPALGERRGLDLVLAQVSVAGCRLRAAAAGGRRDRTPGGPPYLRAGSTTPGGTPWQVWQVGAARPGVRTVVTTSEAGFRAAPFYQAQLVGERVLSTSLGGAPLDVLVDGSSYVTDASATGFELRVALVGLTSLGVPRSDAVAPEDLEAIIGRFSVPVLGLYDYYRNNRNNPRTSLSTGDGLTTVAGSAQTGYATTGDHVITVEDMRAGFDHFAQRHAITLDELARQNTLDLSGAAPLTLRLGAQLVVSRGTTPVNPQQVLELPSFLGDLQSRLGWHVSWLGVER